MNPAGLLVLWLVREIAAQKPFLPTYPDLLQVNGPDLFKTGIPNFVLLGPLRSKLLYSGLQPSGPLKDNVKILCSNRELPDPSELSVNKLKSFNASKPLVLFIHGFVESYLTMKRTNYIASTAKTLLQYRDVNACLVDWTNWAKYDYVSVATVFKQRIGKFVAKFLLRLNQQGVKLADMTLVGHSLGAHILGHAGYLLNGQIGTIFGLDPAGPYFCWPHLAPPSERLSPASAKYVQTIVTSKNGMGCKYNLGHQNFIANFGFFPQPSCLAEHLEPFHCSHYFGTKLFHFSMIPELRFEARKECSGSRFCANTTDLVGIYARRKPGNFYFKTTNHQPYAL